MASRSVSDKIFHKRITYSCFCRCFYLHFGEKPSKRRSSDCLYFYSVKRNILILRMKYHTYTRTVNELNIEIDEKTHNITGIFSKLCKSKTYKNYLTNTIIYLLQESRISLQGSLVNTKIRFYRNLT